MSRLPVMATPTEVSKVDISFNFLMKKFSFAEQEMITVFIADLTGTQEN